MSGISVMSNSSSMGQGFPKAQPFQPMGPAASNNMANMGGFSQGQTRSNSFGNSNFGNSMGGFNMGNNMGNNVGNNMGMNNMGNGMMSLSNQPAIMAPPSSMASPSVGFSSMAPPSVGFSMPSSMSQNNQQKTGGWTLSNPMTPQAQLLLVTV